MAFFGLGKKNTRSGKAPSGKNDTTPPALDDEQEEGGNTAEGEQTDSRSKPEGKSSSKSKRKGTVEQEGTASDVENPRTLIAEAIAHQAFTLAKTNTTLKIAVACLSATTLLSTVLAASAWNQEVEYRYFFMASNGQLLENQPLTEAALSLNLVRDFYSETLSHLFSFHYNNFEMHYQRLGPEVMTERAMLDFANELDRIGLTADMQQRREVAEAVITQVPVLIGSGVDPNTGVYTWELSVPFNIRLESGLDTRNNIRQLSGVASVQVIRVDPAVHPRQILINRITIRDRGQ